jgi:folate-binding protein YgfZ
MEVSDDDSNPLLVESMIKPAHEPTEGAGSTELVALPWLSLLRIGGPEAAAFLDRQLTINVSSLQPTDAAIGCWCDAKGRSLSTLWIKRDVNADEGFLLACHHSLRDQISKRLQLFILRAAVTVQPVNDLHMAVRTDQKQWPSICWRELRCVSSSNAACCENDDLAQQWARHEILAGFVWLDEHTTATYLPQMLAMSRWQALDFGKGCFPGQEIIARAHYLGRVKRGLYRFEAVGRPDNLECTDDTVRDQHGLQIGEVISEVSTPCANADQQNVLRCGLAVLQIATTFSDTVLCYAKSEVKFTPINNSE